LIGVEPMHEQAGNGKKVRTKYYLQTTKEAGRTRKGVFGNMVSFIGVTESQHRGTLHFHGIFFGGLRPELLQSVSHDSDMASAIAVALDSMYQAEIPREMHILSFLSSKFPQGRTYIPPVIRAQKTTENNIGLQCMEMAHTTNYHKHTFTCHKPPNGHTGCRLCFGRGNTEKTCLVELDPSSEEASDIVVMQEISPPPDLKVGPLVALDPRILAWEVRRPTLESLRDIPDNLSQDSAERKNWILSELKNSMPRNTARREATRVLTCLEGLTLDGLEIVYLNLQAELPFFNRYVVEYNSTLTALIGSNTDAMLLGNMEQSKATMFYLAPYLQKDKFQVLQMLTIALESRRFIDTLSIHTPSVAGEAGTTERYVQRWLARAMNSLDVAKEITLNQAAATLLGQNVEMNSDSYVMIGIWEAYNWSTQKRYGKLSGCASDDDDSENSQETDHYDHDDSFLVSDSSNGTETHSNASDFFDDAGDLLSTECVEIVDIEAVDRHSRDDSSHISPQGKCDDFGPATIYNVVENDRKIPIPVFFPHHYHCRGELLKNMNRAEYYCLVDVKPKPNNQEKEPTSRQKKKKGQKAEQVP
jgi:hypothetical protein